MLAFRQTEIYLVPQHAQRVDPGVRRRGGSETERAQAQFPATTQGVQARTVNALKHRGRLRRHEASAEKPKFLDLLPRLGNQ